MAEALFYHLTERPLEMALPELLMRTLQRGWRAVVRARSEERVAFLNRHLWTYDEAGFLPHGAADDGASDRQPVYLTAGEEAPNGADVLFLVDGAAADPREIARFERTCLLFDSADPDALAAARAAWKAVTAAQLKAVYWAQEPGGKWVKKAENAEA